MCLKRWPRIHLAVSNSDESTSAQEVSSHKSYCAVPGLIEQRSECLIIKKRIYIYIYTYKICDIDICTTRTTV